MLMFKIPGSTTLVVSQSKLADPRYTYNVELSKEDENNSDNGSSQTGVVNNTTQVEEEWTEQDEPGVFITLVTLHDGTRDLQRIRFSQRRFAEHQAETWWSENREKVCEKYNVKSIGKINIEKK